MEPDTLEIGSEHRDQLRHAYDTAYPRECCGVLMGFSTGARRIVRQVVSTLNAVSTVGSFAIPDQELRRVRRLAAEAGLAIVAVFHSHPSGFTDLSREDRVALEYSEWPWVILTESGAQGELKLTWYAAG
jgi:proteasome lid subunit RPN8/RPN11